MRIERINSYDDERFPREILLEHGAFLIDGCEPCSFKILDHRSAAVSFCDYANAAPVIEEFRFYAEHITCFFDDEGNVIAEYPQVFTREMPLSKIQPSQFYADEDKVAAIATFVKSADDVIIPVAYDERIGRFVSLDGHTRMFYAHARGWTSVRVFESRTDEAIFSFADEARRRGVYSAADIVLLPHEEYREKWDRFCDDFFAKGNRT